MYSFSGFYFLDLDLDLDLLPFDLLFGLFDFDLDFLDLGLFDFFE